MATEKMEAALREEIAALCHDQWSGWMDYMFGKCVFISGENSPASVAEIPVWAVDRWQRQMNTPYAELSEAEKESDRKEADRLLAIIERRRSDRDALSQKVVEAARFLCPPNHPGYSTWGHGARKLADALAELDAAEGGKP